MHQATEAGLRDRLYAGRTASNGLYSGRHKGSIAARDVRLEFTQDQRDTGRRCQIGQYVQLEKL